MDYTYWYDHDYTTRQSGCIGSGGLQLDVSQLAEGMHTISIQLGSGRTAQLQEYVFYKPIRLDSLYGRFAMDYTYWYDHDYATRQSGSISSCSLQLDVSQLAEGMQTISIQLGSGRTAQLQEYVFYKLIRTDSLYSQFTMDYTYWYDHDYATRQSGSISSGSLQLDVSQLAEGMHTISIQLGSGRTAQLQHYHFFKPIVSLLDSSRHIVKYEYFLNGDEQQKRVAMVAPCDTFQLVALLPVDTLPLCSTSFQFVPNGGHPIIYAKNNVTFRFYTNDRRYVEQSADYADEHVKDTIVADTLERDTTKIIACPTNNRIHWFKLSAGVGDSLSFRTSHPCSMQLFAPSGQEVFASEGSGSLAWDGCHAREEGVYYLAVHDAEGAANLAVSYQWIYRYAVLAQDVSEVGDRHQSIITLDGNGFDSIQSVYLHKDGKDTVWSQLAYAPHNALLRVLFQFDNVAQGIYDMHLTFAGGEQITLEKCLRVMPYYEGEIISTLEAPETTLQDTMRHTLKITNTGNVSALDMPVAFRIIATKRRICCPKVNVTTRTRDGIPRNETISTGGTPLGNGLSDQDKGKLKEWVDKTYGDDLLFNKSEEEGGYEVRENTLFVDVPPYGSVEISMDIPHTFMAGEGIEYDYVVPQYNRYTYHEIAQQEDQAAGGQTGIGTWWCEHHDKVECAANVAAMGMEAAGVSAMVGFGVQAAATISGAISTYLCNQDISPTDPIAAGMLPMQAVKAMTSGSLLEGSSRLLDGWKSAVGKVGGITTAASCIKAFWPSRDKRHTKRTTKIAPSDPNDIVGYTAASGSKSVGKEQQQLDYLIEFENDSLVASAMARTVVITDTLDADVFDLGSFAADGVTIGQQTINLDGLQHSTRTLDMRPAIDMIAQVELDYSAESGIATWTFSSLDPLTLAPTTSDSLGFLSIGGTGEVHFTINRKPHLPDSTLIANRAHIKFDREAPMATSTWVNIIDNHPPTSAVSNVSYANGQATIAIVASDNLSGTWRYDVYGLLPSDQWLPLAMNVPADTVAVVDATEGQYAAFLTLATDSAGNAETMASPQDTAKYTLTLLCDTTQGRIVGAGQYAAGDTATIEAIASRCHHFSQWSDGVADNPRRIVLTCDSSLTALFAEDIVAHEHKDVSACDTYTWFSATGTDSTYTNSGHYLHSYTNAGGCTQVDTLHLTLHRSTTDTLTATAYGAYEWRGRQLTSSGFCTDSLLSIYGCDSILVLQLSITHTQSIATVDGESITLYPNPTSGKLVVVADQLQSVEVYNVSGQRVLAVLHGRELDLSSLPSGVYTLRIAAGQATHLTRVVKQ